MGTRELLATLQTKIKKEIDIMSKTNKTIVEDERGVKTQANVMKAHDT